VSCVCIVLPILPASSRVAAYSGGFLVKKRPPYSHHIYAQDCAQGRVCQTSRYYPPYGGHFASCNDVRIDAWIVPCYRLVLPARTVLRGAAGNQPVISRYQPMEVTLSTAAAVRVSINKPASTMRVMFVAPSPRLLRL